VGDRRERGVRVAAQRGGDGGRRQHDDRAVLGGAQLGARRRADRERHAGDRGRHQRADHEAVADQLDPVTSTTSAASRRASTRWPRRTRRRTAWGRRLGHRGARHRGEQRRAQQQVRAIHGRHVTTVSIDTEGRRGPPRAASFIRSGVVSIHNQM
jgi:hypothetical protein